MTFLQFAMNNVKRNARVYLAYFLSSVFTIMVFFSFAINLFHPTIASRKGGALELILGQAEAVILVFSFLFIWISVSAFLKVRSREFGTLLLLGMSPQQLYRLIFLENMIIGGLAILTGIILGLVFAKLWLMVLSRLLADEFVFYFPLTAIGLTVGLFVLIFLGISASTPYVIRTQNVRALLVGAKKPNREIHFSKVLAAVAILLLGMGYFMAISPQLYDLHPWLDQLVLLLENIPYVEAIISVAVVMGTYLFFEQFSVWVLHRLKRNKEFYLKKTRLLWVSDLMYRIRDNARMLFIVTILSTVAFTAVTGVYALSSVVKDESMQDHPFALTFISSSHNQGERQQLKIINEMLQRQGFDYHVYQAEVLKQVTAKRTTHLLRLSDYNARATVLGFQPVRLRQDQALLVPIYVRYDPKRDKTLSQKQVVLNDGNIRLRVKGVAPKVIFYAGLFQNLVVVHDETYEKLANIQERYRVYSYEIPNWLHTRTVVEQLREKLGVGGRDTYFWGTRIEGYVMEAQNKRLFFYVGFFLGAIFFLGASSFLYFRLYTDLNQEKDKYRGLAKIGLSFQEMNKVASIQIAVLLFGPFLLAGIHSFFAISILQTVLYSSVFRQFLTVMGAFLLLNLLDYLIIRSQYVRDLRKVMMQIQL